MNIVTKNKIKWLGGGNCAWLESSYQKHTHAWATQCALIKKCTVLLISPDLWIKTLRYSSSYCSSVQKLILPSRLYNALTSQSDCRQIWCINFELHTKCIFLVYISTNLSLDLITENPHHVWVCHHKD